jgi:regulator of sirC expression with transglutaminase-like and TPR domain
MFTHQMAERIVDLEDTLVMYKTNHELLVKANIRRELDPSRLESALRMYVAELDYDIHKNLENGEEDGLDHYGEEVDFFLRCWYTAGEGK